MSVDPRGRPTVSIQQACELVEVTRRTIYNWLRDGRIEYVRTAGGSVRIIRESLFRPADCKPLPRGFAATSPADGATGNASR